MGRSASVLVACRRCDGLIPSQGVQDTYLSALAQFGIIPILVPGGIVGSQLLDLLGQVSGILFTGGEDVSLEFGGACAVKASAMSPDVRRDRLEFDLFHAADELRLPVLAICRGHQVVNVACGGKLLGDIQESNPNAHQHMGPLPEKGAANTAQMLGAYHHQVSVRADTLLHSILKKDRLLVNSFHHQAVDPSALGAGLVVSALAEDGTIEAIEAIDSLRFLLGVQWHPEMLVKLKDPSALALFEAFATRVKQGH